MCLMIGVVAPRFAEKLPKLVGHVQKKQVSAAVAAPEM